MSSSKHNRTSTPKSKKRQFSGFTKAEAFKQLGLSDLLPWNLEVEPVQPSGFFREHIARLNRNFDLESYEESKKLLIDALLSEAIDQTNRLKIWKGASLEGDTTAGYVDYLVAERKRFLETPLLCVIEARKDDFERGLAQCLVEMQACRWQNQQANRSVDVIGIVTNGTSWQFYRLTVEGEAYESSTYSIGDLELLLGRLQFVMQMAQQNLG